MKMKSLIFIISLILGSVSSVFAQVVLPTFISDNMVLQQQTVAPLWGKAKPGAIVTLSCSWDNNKYETKASAEGRWKQSVKTPKAGGPYTITINEQKIENVLIGEVWLCSGQSNMQWAMRNTDNGFREAASANNPNIRLFYAARQLGDAPQLDSYGKWEESSPQSVIDFSAVAYFFGKELNKELGDTPIGLIHTSWGGSSAQAWVKDEILRDDPLYDCYYEREKKNEANAAQGVLSINQISPSRLYNAMIHPFIPYAIQGVIWYQGESNASVCPGDPERYEKLFPTLIKSWREEWNQGDFPFYYVQIAPFQWGVSRVGAMVRDAQRKSLYVKNTGMAVTMDIGNPYDIHPRNKKDVGKRLALWALAKDYGKKDITYSGPLFKSIELKGKRAIISFSHTGSGLMSKGGELTHFEMAGEDKVFYKANAVIQGETVSVTSDKVKKPAAVRYAFYNTDEPNLFNIEGLPASSFRTDNWPIETESIKPTF
ncbi:sialate O-acetylesterase [Arenibacter sp. F26102]|uniref:sialate O-acetylesterase n=1 Tax=Arenibacter sp. F26102 TaxID=2926416 RepID=UPI001FF220E5|nr:sialate O-acetylesterase [Arenibacter sp. F26102]MCK0148091.1 sialate O-acetylesterase [Arenibacter sp. F26102]